MTSNSDNILRDCIFYEEYRDMGASTDFCTVRGSSWEDTQGCHCNGYPNLFTRSNYI